MSIETNQPHVFILTEGHVAALTAVLNDYEPDRLTWNESELQDLDEAIDILNGRSQVNFAGEVIVK